MKQNAIIYFYLFFFFQLNASGYKALNYWYHPHSVSIVGASSNYISAENDRLNPAFIINSEKLMSLSFVQYPSEITSQLAQVIYPHKKYVLTATIRHISYGIFKGYNENGTPTSNYSASDTWVSCSAVKSFYSKNIHLGATVGYFYSNIGDLSSMLLTGTTGMSLNIDRYKMNIGIALRNFTFEMKSYSSNKYYNPILINISSSKKLAYLPLIMIIDSDFDIQSKLNNIRLSGIITLTKDINFKLGTSINRVDQSEKIDFFKDIFADTGLGVSISTKQYIVDLGTYFYGMGGTVFAMGIGLKL
jgi:hypothetical protein